MIREVRRIAARRLGQHIAETAAVVSVILCGGWMDVATGSVR